MLLQLGTGPKFLSISRFNGETKIHIRLYYCADGAKPKPTWYRATLNRQEFKDIVNSYEAVLREFDRLDNNKQTISNQQPTEVGADKTTRVIMPYPNTNDEDFGMLSIVKNEPTCVEKELSWRQPLDVPNYFYLNNYACQLPDGYTIYSYDTSLNSMDYMCGYSATQNFTRDTSVGVVEKPLVKRPALDVQTFTEQPIPVIQGVKKNPARRRGKIQQ